MYSIILLSMLLKVSPIEIIINFVNSFPLLVLTIIGFCLSQSMCVLYATEQMQASSIWFIDAIKYRFDTFCQRSNQIDRKFNFCIIDLWQQQQQQQQLGKVDIASCAM